MFTVYLCCCYPIFKALRVRNRWWFKAIQWDVRVMAIERRRQWLAVFQFSTMYKSSGGMVAAVVDRQICDNRARCDADQLPENTTRSRCRNKHCRPARISSKSTTVETVYGLLRNQPAAFTPPIACAYGHGQRRLATDQLWFFNSVQRQPRDEAGGRRTRYKVLFQCKSRLQSGWMMATTRVHVYCSCTLREWEDTGPATHRNTVCIITRRATAPIFLPACRDCETLMI